MTHKRRLDMGCGGSRPQDVESHSVEAIQLENVDSTTTTTKAQRVSASILASKEAAAPSAQDAYDELQGALKKSASKLIPSAAAAAPPLKAPSPAPSEDDFAFDLPSADWDYQAAAAASKASGAEEEDDEELSPASQLKLKAQRVSASILASKESAAPSAQVAYEELQGALKKSASKLTTDSVVTTPIKSQDDEPSASPSRQLSPSVSSVTAALAAKAAANTPDPRSPSAAASTPFTPPDVTAAAGLWKEFVDASEMGGAIAAYDDLRELYEMPEKVSGLDAFDLLVARADSTMPARVRETVRQLGRQRDRRDASRDAEKAGRDASPSAPKATPQKTPAKTPTKVGAGQAASPPALVVVVSGAGPVGLRCAIECVLQGMAVSVLERRETFSRVNILTLWPQTADDLMSFGAKLFYPRFTNHGDLLHLGTREIQLVLFKAGEHQPPCSLSLPLSLSLARSLALCLTRLPALSRSRPPPPCPPPYPVSPRPIP